MNEHKVVLEGVNTRPTISAFGEDTRQRVCGTGGRDLRAAITNRTTQKWPWRGRSEHSSRIEIERSARAGKQANSVQAYSAREVLVTQREELLFSARRFYSARGVCPAADNRPIA
jgi:hypothetical protein